MKIIGFAFIVVTACNVAAKKDCDCDEVIGTFGEREDGLARKNGEVFSGTCRSYHEDGKTLWMKASYLNGKLHGTYRVWDIEGDILMDKKYERGYEVPARAPGE